MRWHTPPSYRKLRRPPPMAAAIIADPQRASASVMVIDCGNASAVSAEHMVRSAALSAEIVLEFRAAVAATGRAIPAEGLVLRLLAEAPFILDVNVAAARVVGCEGGGYQAKRKSVW